MTMGDSHIPNLEYHAIPTSDNPITTQVITLTQGCIFPIIRQFLRWNSFENLTHFRNSFYFWSVLPEFFFEKHEILGKNMKNMVLNAQKDELSLKISQKLNPSCI